MRSITLTLLILLCPVSAGAQDNYGFPFGKTTLSELDMTFPADTAADAFVIKEVAEAHIDYESFNKIIFTYHVKVKILNQNAASRADVRVPLIKGSEKSRVESIRAVQASAFNIVNNRIHESKIDPKTVFIEKSVTRNYDLASFAIPDVKAGTIIEYQYVIESPFIFNFRKWEFQSDIPKLYSEYWTVIPANYVYNITLRGYISLASKVDNVVPKCLTDGTGATADCVSTRYVMKNIPAFKEEEYMTAKENFMAAINFQLSEVRFFDGRVDKVTKEWKDADQELRQADNFGQQLRKGKDVVDGYLNVAVLGEPDQLMKAKKIYDFVKFHFAWNEYYGDRSDLGIKKAFDQKTGNVADINLSLIAALRYAGFKAEPVLIATRGVERPTELHPVLSDFNYVIAKVNVGDKMYLLDAVDDLLPFGLISETCYNGKGRVIADEGSYWMDIKPTERDRVVTQVNLKLLPEGVMKGTITSSYYGYASIDKRRKMMKFNDEKSYLDDLISKNHVMSIDSYKRTLEDDLSRAVVEVFEVEISAFDTPTTTHFLFNPFLGSQNKKNPLKTETRNFPVDYGIPIDRSLILTVDYPGDVEITSLPDKIGMALPASGGRYIYSALTDGAKLSVSNIFSINKPLYQPEEYPYLRELYARMIQTENADIIFRKKK